MEIQGTLCQLFHVCVLFKWKLHFLLQLFVHLIRILLSHRGQMEKFPQPLECNSKDFLLPKSIPNQWHQGNIWDFQIPGRKYRKIIRKLLWFFSVLIEACILRGCVFYKYLLKLQWETWGLSASSPACLYYSGYLAPCSYLVSCSISILRCGWEPHLPPRSAAVRKCCSVCSMCLVSVWATWQKGLGGGGSPGPLVRH